jgi:hypothetical protein
MEVMANLRNIRPAKETLKRMLKTDVIKLFLKSLIPKTKPLKTAPNHKR